MGSAPVMIFMTIKSLSVSIPKMHEAIINVDKPIALVISSECSVRHTVSCKCYVDWTILRFSVFL